MFQLLITTCSFKRIVVVQRVHGCVWHLCETNIRSQLTLDHSASVRPDKQPRPPPAAVVKLQKQRPCSSGSAWATLACPAPAQCVCSQPARAARARKTAARLPGARAPPPPGPAARAPRPRTPRPGLHSARPRARTPTARGPSVAKRITAIAGVQARITEYSIQSCMVCGQLSVHGQVRFG